MIQIYPNIEQKFTCPICNNETDAIKILWQGIHAGAETKCKKCQKVFYQDFNVGHSISKPCSVDLDNFEFFCTEDPKGWYAKPLRDSLQSQNNKKIEFKKEVYADYEKVVILNCIDYLYGHSLLKLLNAERHIKSNTDIGLIVIVPKFLEWMVPEGIAEKWVFNISLKEGQECFTEFNNAIQDEVKRFSEIYVSKTFPHPGDFDISNFTGVVKHNFQEEDFRITFVWRDDRFWISNLLFEKGTNKSDIKILKNIVLMWQKRKIIKLFTRLKKKFPYAKYTVVGIGMPENFPAWIDNKTVQKIDADQEKNLCHIYSESRVIIGVHGSNMLLPSAHAGMVIDLMPDDRWGNFAQDILYQEKDFRISSFRYRYLPININVDTIQIVITSMLVNRDTFIKNMTE